jgi:hypothetical protein
MAAAHVSSLPLVASTGPIERPYREYRSKTLVDLVNVNLTSAVSHTTSPVT